MHNIPSALVLVNLRFFSAEHHRLLYGEEMVDLLLNYRAGVWRSSGQNVTEKGVEAEVSDCVIQCSCVWPPSQESSAPPSSTCFRAEKELPHLSQGPLVLPKLLYCISRLLDDH